MSSENIFPKSFSKLKRGVPVRGLTLAFGLVTLVSLVLGGVFIAEYGFFNGLFDAWLICVTTATVSALIVHALANVALFNSARKNKIRNFLTHYVLPAGSTLFIFIVLFYSLMGISYPLIIAPIIVVIFIILIAGYVAIKRQLFLKLPEAAP
jgi:amino acid transporter